VNTTPPAAHPEHEDYPWTIQIPDHPPRTDTPEYVASRRRMNDLANGIPDLVYGPAPHQDHHGGGLWLKDADGWFLVRNLAGIEWSAQFCADPAKVDSLRRNARRLYAAFPEAVAELGIRDLLDTEITDADGVQRWTDSICNASVPLSAAFHTGVLPTAETGGVHHYPSPITEIELFKHDDFPLWVRTDDGALAAVVPVGRRGSGDGRTRLLFAAVPTAEGEETPLERIAGPPAPAPAADEERGAAALPGRAGLPAGEDPTILPATHPLSLRAFAEQTREAGMNRKGEGV
jgi:Family of unknown function (DUF6424)